MLRIEVIDRTSAAILAAKTPAERIAIAAAAHRTARAILRSRVEQLHPDWTPDERHRELLRLLHGDGIDGDRHLRDIAGILRVTGGGVDRAEVERWATELGYLDIWRQVVAKADAPDPLPGPGVP